jgi:hypothetical protein
MRRQFNLPEQDVTFLEGLGLPWEAIIDRGMQWVLVYDYPLPLGYTHPTVTVAIKIETGYPRAALDMAYFLPHIERADGKGINAISAQQIDNKLFQRWSRHRTAANPWREGLDDLSTHLGLVTNWFEEEFKKHANGIAA